jgi:Uma2 family endonuclease
MLTVVMNVRTKRWTRAEYDSLVANGAFPPGSRVQLLDGEILETTPQSPEHAMAVQAVQETLRSVFGDAYTIRVHMPLGVGDVSEPEPDVAVVRGHFREYRQHPESAVLMVEVADSSLEFDRSGKAVRYASGEISEYWIVNLVDRRLEVFRDPDGSAYRTRLILDAVENVAPLAHPDSLVLVSSLLP